MSFAEFNRSALRFHPLNTRKNRVRIERDHVPPDAAFGPIDPGTQRIIDETAERLRAARNTGAPRMAAFGAHTIKNGLAPVLAEFIKDGWLTHLATNGAGIIHDWEFAYCGESSEHVERNLHAGRFGLWEETGRYLNLALAVGAYEGKGYGESIGALVERDGLTIPEPDELRADVSRQLNPNPARAAAAADLLTLVDRHRLPPGWLDVAHPFKIYGLQAAAFRLGVPYTGHPMIGHDIIYTHPLNACAAVGRTAERDFLRFAHGVSKLSGGVYLSIGSAVMSPMIFEKSLAMAQNVALLNGKRIDGHFILVADLAPATWDWNQGEPPEDHPEYYQRYNKTFSRMGGTRRYVSIENRTLLLALLRALRNT